MNLKSPVDFLDLQPKQTNLLKEVLVGLSKVQKTIPPKFLYDDKGSNIFEKNCDLPEYYPTRAETEIFKTHSLQMAKMIGEGSLIIEPGSGSGEKVRYLLRQLESPSGYVPIEISKQILLRMTQELTLEFPNLRVLPICADFSQALDLPLSVESQKGMKVIFFPGSIIGNQNPSEAIELLRKFGKIIGPNGGLIIGVDLKKKKEAFKLAYDDPQGITSDFNLNLLERLNREVGASFDSKKFRHEAFYNEQLGRVEMHLKSIIPQIVRVNQTVFRFREGETIHTENSYKYSVDEFCELCAKAKLKIIKHWKDSKNLFCVYYFERE